MLERRSGFVVLHCQAQKQWNSWLIILFRKQGFNGSHIAASSLTSEWKTNFKSTCL
jgi:hypothetical protein